MTKQQDLNTSSKKYSQQERIRINHGYSLYTRLLILIIVNILCYYIGKFYSNINGQLIERLISFEISIEAFVLGLIFILAIIPIAAFLISIIHLLSDSTQFKISNYVLLFANYLGMFIGAFEVTVINHTKNYIYLLMISALVLHIACVKITIQARREDVKWKWLRDFAVYCGTIGGASFYRMNLTGIVFDGADLRNTDLRETILTHASFIGAKNIELARIKGTILEDKRVRDLLIDPKSGQGKNFSGADFTGAYLVKANLQGADLTGANFQNVNLTGANLAAANLRCVNAIDTDFTDATLHDICIQDWNISKNTTFANVKCRGVYLKENQQEPKPDSYGSVNGKEFQAGEFEKWVKVLTNTIDLIFQNGLDLKSLAFAITQASIDYENTQFTAESIEHKGDGVVVVKVSSTGKASKSELHIALTNEYKYAQDAIASGHELVLRAKEEEIARLTYRMEAQDRQIHGLIACISQPKESSSVTIHKYYNSTHHSTQEGHIVEQQYQAGGNIDQSNRSINAGRDFNSTGSVINSDEMRGQITNTVNQNQDLAEIISSLQKLQTAIQDDPNLKEAAKARSLEEVKVLSEEAKKEPHERDKSILPKAISCLSYLGELVTDGSKLSQICQTYLPTISKFFGL